MCNVAKIVIVVLFFVSIFWFALVSSVEDNYSKSNLNPDDALPGNVEKEIIKNIDQENADATGNLQNIHHHQQLNDRKKRADARHAEESENNKQSRSAHRLQNRQQDDDDTPVIIKRSFFNYLLSAIRDDKYPGVELYTQYAIESLGLKPLTNVVPLQPEFGPVFNDVSSINYPLTVQDCRKNGSAPRSLFIVVIFHPLFRTTAIAVSNSDIIVLLL